jgi:hypothetical protein
MERSRREVVSFYGGINIAPPQCIVSDSRVRVTKQWSQAANIDPIDPIDPIDHI